jgi:hypothetical protein
MCEQRKLIYLEDLYFIFLEHIERIEHQSAYPEIGESSRTVDEENFGKRRFLLPIDKDRSQNVFDTIAIEELFMGSIGEMNLIGRYIDEKHMKD